jgi:hypothetical protein
VLLRHPFRSAVAAVGVSALVATLAVAVAPPDAAAQTPTFSDLDETIHAEAIELVAADGIAGGFPDGTYRPRNDVRRDQMATFLARALELDEVPSTFPDVPEASLHFGTIGAIADAGITQGFTDGTYRPLGYVTRGQMARFLADGFDLPPGDETFSDVPATYVHAPAIAALASSGITAGFPDGTFRPNSLVKRDQMARFLANAVPLPREQEPEPEPPCPTPLAAPRATTSAAVPAPTVSAEERSLQSGDAVDSEDVRELRAAEPDTRRVTADDEEAAPPTADPVDLGHAVPGVAFPLTSAIRTSAGAIEVHSQDLSDSRGAQVADDGTVTATTVVPNGTRTWATTELGGRVYVGQWGTGTGTNLFRYPVGAAEGETRVATAVATIATAGEFWGLAADGQGRLWAGSRAHLDPNVRAEVGVATSGIVDQRHVVHRIDRLDSATPRVSVVAFADRCLPTTAAGQRPDVKQVAAHGSTLYVGLGQQANGARLYAFEPGERTQIPGADVRDLTPRTVLSGRSIFTLRVTDAYIAVGTEGTATAPARLVVLDRATEQVRVDVALPGEIRVDAIAIAGNRVVASALTGRLYQTTVPAAGAPVASTATALEAPIAGQFSRLVEVLANGSLRGISNQGLVWTRSASTGEVELVNLVDTGAPVDAGLPHSLHAGSAEVAVGSTSAVTLRTRDEVEPAPRTVSIQGEAKAMTSAPAGDTFVASYPNAQLWHIGVGADAAETVQGWDAAYTRPADAGYDARTDEVHVVAREEGEQVSEPCTGCGDGRTRFFYRASRLFSVDTVSPGAGQVAGSALRNSTGGTVEASTLAVGDDGGSRDVYVGDTRGGVQRVDAADGGQDWYVEPVGDRRWRSVVDVELVDDRLVVTTSGNLVIGGTNQTRTLIDERDPETGDLLRSQVVSNIFIAGDAVSSGHVTVLTRRNQLVLVDRDQGAVIGTVAHASNASFGGPYAAIGDDCDLFHLVGVPSHLFQRTLTAGACGPDEPVDPEEPADAVGGGDPVP